MRELLILGAGGQARETALIVEALNRHAPTWNLRGFVTRDGGVASAPAGRYRVVCGEASAFASNAALVVAIGDPVVLARVAERCHDLPRERFPVLIHPSVFIDERDVQLGNGCIVAAGSVLTTEVVIGAFSYVNRLSTIGHDARVGDCCVLNPGVIVSGGVRIGARSLIGSGACILQDLELGEECRVGAGAVVTKGVGARMTVVGVPARPLRPE